MKTYLLTLCVLFVMLFTFAISNFVDPVERINLILGFIEMLLAGVCLALIVEEIR